MEEIQKMREECNRHVRYVIRAPRRPSAPKHPSDDDSSGFQFSVPGPTLEDLFDGRSPKQTAKIEGEDSEYEKDIRIVMEQANTSRERAIESLRVNNGDIVDAIMYLFGMNE